MHPTIASHPDLTAITVFLASTATRERGGLPYLDAVLPAEDRLAATRVVRDLGALPPDAINTSRVALRGRLLIPGAIRRGQVPGCVQPWAIAYPFASVGAFSCGRDNEVPSSSARAAGSLWGRAADHASRNRRAHRA